jgi:hypothetical protein
MLNRGELLLTERVDTPVQAGAIKRRVSGAGWVVFDLAAFAVVILLFS